MAHADGMTLDRLRTLLDAYGARPDAWPVAERAAADALLARSAEARALRDAAAALDAVLDRAPAIEPTAALAGRVLAGTPRPTVVPFSVRRRRRVRVLAGIGLAAAASLAVWLTNRVAEPPALDPAVVAALGEYDTATDELLSALDLDADEAVPVFGCDDPAVDCDATDLRAPRPAARRPPRNEEMQA